MPPGRWIHTVLAASVCLSTSAATLQLPASNDTSLSENYPSNNLGGLHFLVAGTTQNNTKNRALIRFDVGAELPPKTPVRSVQVVLECVGVPNEPAPFADFALHRLLRPWKEGAQLSPSNCVSCAGQGSPAMPGEATWFVTGDLAVPEWAAPGAGNVADHEPAASGATTIYGVGDSPYIIFSNPKLIGDLQSWIDRPDENYGWLLKCMTEEIPFTARRFGAREGATAAYLELDYLAPPRINQVQPGAAATQIQFSAADGQAYALESAADPWGPWNTVTNVLPQAEPTLVNATEQGSFSRRFYRLSTW